MAILQKLNILNTTTINNIHFLIKTRFMPLVFLMIILIGVSFMEAIGIGSLYPVIDIIQKPAEVTFYAQKINDILPFSIRESRLLLYIIISIMLIFIIKNCFILFANYAQARFANNLQADWKNRIMKVYLTQPYSFFILNSSGELLHKMMSQTGGAAGVLVSIITIIRMMFTFLAIYITFCVLSFKVTIAITIIFLIVMVFFYTISKKIVHRKGVKINLLGQNSYGLASESLSGMRQIKMFVSELWVLNKFTEINKKFALINAQNAIYTTLPTPLLETVAVIGLLSTLFIMTRIAGLDTSTMPTMAVFAGGLYKMFPIVSGISSSIMGISSQLPCVNIVSELLQKKGELQTDIKKTGFLNTINIQDISFEYNHDVPVLQNISINFQKGKFYGIAGPSGSGKSTLIDLLMGFYFPNKGKIIIDEKDITHINIRGWRKTIGVISQETYIFNGTVKENIAFALNEEDKDTEKMIKSAKMADAHEFIEQLPQGYQTLVGERGLKLSGGQRQRLAIARAVYRNPDILIFDEATSSLDAISERKIQKAIETLSHEKTVIVIAHRLSTIKKADYIYVLDRSEIIEQGTHDSMILESGMYASLCAKQGLV